MGTSGVSSADAGTSSPSLGNARAPGGTAGSVLVDAFEWAEPVGLFGVGTSGDGSDGYGPVGVAGSLVVWGEATCGARAGIDKGEGGCARVGDVGAVLDCETECSRVGDDGVDRVKLLANREKYFCRPSRFTGPA